MSELKKAILQAVENTAQTRKNLEDSVSGPCCSKCGRDLWFCMCNAVGPAQRIAALEAALAVERERVRELENLLTQAQLNIAELAAQVDQQSKKLVELNEIKHKYYCFINQTLNSTQLED